MDPHFETTENDVIVPMTGVELIQLGQTIQYEKKSWINFHYNLIVQTVILRASRGLHTINFPMGVYKGTVDSPKKGTMLQEDIDILEKMCREKFPDSHVDFKEIDSEFMDINISW